MEFILPKSGNNRKDNRSDNNYLSEEKVLRELGNEKIDINKKKAMKYIANLKIYTTI